MTSLYLSRPLRTLAQARQNLVSTGRSPAATVPNNTDPNTRNKSMTPAQYARFRFARNERERVTGNREPRRKDKTT